MRPKTTMACHVPQQCRVRLCWSLPWGNGVSWFDGGMIWEGFIIYEWCSVVGRSKYLSLMDGVQRRFYHLWMVHSGNVRGTESGDWVGGRWGNYPGARIGARNYSFICFVSYNDCDDKTLGGSFIMCFPPSHSEWFHDMDSDTLLGKITYSRNNLSNDNRGNDVNEQWSVEHTPSICRDKWITPKIPLNTACVSDNENTETSILVVF